MSSRKNWELGASSCITTNAYGVSDYAFRLFKEAGIKHTEISLRIQHSDEFNFIENAEKILELTKKNGVEMWSLHIPFSQTYHPALLDEEASKAFMEKCLKEIDAGIRIGIKTIVIHPSSEPNEPEDREALMRKSIENMTVLSKYCRERGAVLAVEDLPRTCLGNCFEEMLRFIKEVPYLQICFDTNHLLGQTVEEFLDGLIAGGMKGKIRTVHVSDYDFVNERHWLPLEGVIDWERLIGKLEELDYNGVFMYEVGKPSDRDFFYSLEDVKENFNKIVKK